LTSKLFGWLFVQREGVLQRSNLILAIKAKNDSTWII